MLANKTGDSVNIVFKVRKYYSESAYETFYFSIYILLKIQLYLYLA